MFIDMEVPRDQSSGGAECCRRQLGIANISLLWSCEDFNEPLSINISSLRDFCCCSLLLLLNPGCTRSAGSGIDGAFYQAACN
jgi:hypothetical protein